MAYVQIQITISQYILFMGEASFPLNINEMPKFKKNYNVYHIK